MEKVYFVHLNLPLPMPLDMFRTRLGTGAEGFSVLSIPVLEQECVVVGLLWPNPHVCVVVNDIDATVNLMSAHEQGSLSLGPGSNPDL